jgi:hypothetical protein
VKKISLIFHNLLRKEATKSIILNFFVNDDDVTDVDAWFIIEDPYKKYETCNVPPENVIYFSAEASYPLGWYDDEKKYNDFFSQFSKVISCHPIVHKNFQFEPPYLPWAINANHGSFFKNIIGIIIILKIQNYLLKKSYCQLFVQIKSLPHHIN